MSEFTEKLNSSELVSNAWVEIDRDQACAGLLIDTISNEFKDWQPPKTLVVVPQFVADAIESIPDYYSAYGAIRLIDMKLTELPLENGDWKYVHDWIFVDDNANEFVKAWLDGYTVEKEKLYRLKNKITNQYINMNPYNGHCQESMTFGDFYKCVFTQSEIDGMETGSYEQIEVTE